MTRHSAYRLCQNWFVFLTLQLQQYVHLLSLLQLLLHSLQKQKGDQKSSISAEDLNPIIYFKYQADGISTGRSFFPACTRMPKASAMFTTSYCSNSTLPKTNPVTWKREQAFGMWLMFSQLHKVLFKNANVFPIYIMQVAVKQLSHCLFTNLNFNPEHNLWDVYEGTCHAMHKEVVHCLCLPWHLRILKPLANTP